MTKEALLTTSVDVQSVKSGARILDLLELIAARETPIGLSEVVAELEIPKSSALMLLRTLVTKYYVERDADGRYRLDRLYRSSSDDWVGGRAAVLRRRARPLMEKLVAAVQETVVIGVLTPSLEVEVVDKVRSPREVRYEIEVGAIYPAYCTALGRAILGWSEPGLTDDYLDKVQMVKCTPSTVTDPDRIRRLLGEVRDLGYAVNIEEHVQGASSVAAPLLDAGGTVVAALNVGCVTAHFRAHRKHIINALVQTANAINERLRAGGS
jgi:IclR family transcriptional regulator, pca regulon regulatory protein